MRTSFFGLNVALSGLFTAQRGLDTVNHNINNVTTPGYSRQQGLQQASRAMPVYDGTGMVGTGAEVTGVERVHDEYLDFKYWSENISYGEWSVKNAQLSEVERTFNEPSDSGFNKVLDEFYSSMQELSKDPSSTAARKLVIGKGETVAKYFNSVAVHMEKLQADLNYNIKIKVDEINSLGSQILQLNKQIYASELDGNSANDLRDQRGVLVDNLSKLVNIQANEVVAGKLPSGRDDKHFVITISGKTFVDHFNNSTLKVTQRENKLNPNEDIDNLFDVGWSDGNKLEIKGGELKGYLDVRDGNEGDSNSPIYKGVPFYIKKLDDFVRKFAMAMNEGITEGYDPSGSKVFTKVAAGHAGGFGLQNPIDNVSSSGIRFFTVNGFSAAKSKYTELDSSEFIDSSIEGDKDAIGSAYQKIKAKNFSVSGDLLNQQYAEYNIAASSIAGEAEDKGNLLNLIDMRHDSHLFVEGTPEDYMKSLVSSLGIDSQQAERISTNQSNITKQIENRKQSISGVSLDEEMANLVKYQHAYNAAAKMVTTMAEIYNTLINKLGV